MTRFFCLPLLLASCAAEPVVAVDPAQAAACRRTAWQTFPERPRLTAAPGDALGHHPGEYFDFDTNAPRREAALTACLAAR